MWLDRGRARVRPYKPSWPHARGADSPKNAVSTTVTSALDLQVAAAGLDETARMFVVPLGIDSGGCGDLEWPRTPATCRTRWCPISSRHCRRALRVVPT